jgi:predicted ester cyclase
MEQPTNELLVKGEHRALSERDWELLELTSKRRPKHIPEDYLKLLAHINRRASSHPKYGKVISPACYAAYLAPGGESATGTVYRWGARDPVDPPLTIPTVIVGVDFTSSWRDVARGTRNKLIVQTIYEEIWNKGRLELADELIDSKYVRHAADELSSVGGPESEKQGYAVTRNAFPDWHFFIKDMIAEGDKVATRFTARGTHQGEFMGFAPTGKQVTLVGIVVDRVRRGKVVESWVSSDMWGLVQQLIANSK